MSANFHELLPAIVRNLGDETIQTVNARDLHGLLKVDARFADWIKRRLTEAQARQGIDYIRQLDFSSLRNQTGRGGDRRSIEYIVSLDMAKHVAMLERTEIGRAVRQHLIDVEKTYRLGQLAAVHGEPFDRTVFGGIVKAVVRNELKQLIDAEIERRFALDPRVGAVMHKSALEVAKDLGAAQKRRRSLVQRIGNFFRRVCKREGIAIPKCPRSGTDLFQIDLIERFRHSIVSMVKDHNDRIAGQGVLKFVKP